MDYTQLSNFFAGEPTHEEKESLLASLNADKDLLEEAVGLKNSWAVSALTTASTDTERARKGWKVFRAKINRQKYVMLQRRRVAVAAAVACIIVAASFFTSHFVNRTKPAETACHTLSVPAGQYAQLTLVDGSEIWLNASSKLIYPDRFTSSTREIWLEGEGLFKVVSDKKRPFIVKTEWMDIIATGTQFNVSAYTDDNKVVASLVEGIVNLYSAANNIDFKVEQGTVAVYDKKERLISNQNTNADLQTLWIQGEYQFREATLEEITKRIERYYGMKFIFENEALTHRKFTGAFYTRQSVEAILSVIQASTNIQYTIENDSIFIK